MYSDHWCILKSFRKSERGDFIFLVPTFSSNNKIFIFFYFKKLTCNPNIINMPARRKAVAKPKDDEMEVEGAEADTKGSANKAKKTKANIEKALEGKIIYQPISSFLKSFLWSIKHPWYLISFLVRVVQTEAPIQSTSYSSSFYNKHFATTSWRKEKKQYLVKYKGLGDEDNTWVDESKLTEILPF